MSEMRLFKVKQDYPIHYGDGTCRVLLQDTIYVDSLGSVDYLARTGARVMMGGDLGNEREMLSMIPRDLNTFHNLILLAWNGGFGDVICREPALRWMGYPGAVIKHDQLGLVPHCTPLPLELSQLDDRIVIDWHTCWDRIPTQLIPLQRCHARSIGIDPGDDYDWKVRVLVDKRRANIWQERLDTAGLPHPWIVVQVAASNYVRTYPPAMLLAALERVKSEVPCSMILGGFSKDIPLVLSPYYQGKGYYGALSRTPDSKDFVALLSNADLIISPASGACHVGEALDINTVLINSIYPVIYEAGLHPKLHLIQTPADCAPGDFTTCATCKKETSGIRDCWWQLPPSVVADQILEAMKCL
jgi:hypothetical protein